jgi:hypothetical protein
VDSQHGVPLLVGHLVNNTIPGEAGVVDNDVNLAVAKLCGLLDKIGKVCVVKDVAGDSDGLAAVVSDGLRSGSGLFCLDISFSGFGIFVIRTYRHQYPR